MRKAFTIAVVSVVVLTGTYFYSSHHTVQAVSSTVVISQVYGGGGNSGSTYKNDFIEIFNLGPSTIPLTGYSVQYASSAGTTWQVTNLTGSIAPGQYYLVQEAVGTGGTTNLPTPDATGTIAMSATSAKVALVAATTALAGSCPLSSSYVDLVGYGTGTSQPSCVEGTTGAPTLTNTTAALRKNGGCQDTDSNSGDFTSGAPTPRNTAAAMHSCAPPALSVVPTPLPAATINVSYSTTLQAAGGSGTYTTWAVISGSLPSGLSLTASSGLISGTPDVSATTQTFTVQVTDSSNATASAQLSITVSSPTCNPSATIAQIQGNGNASPLAGQTVTTRGIVTHQNSNGFFIQMPSPGDGDPTTSDGVFVFTSSAPPSAATVANDVCVTGKVAEYVPSSDPSSLSTTEIDSPTVVALAGNQLLPAPVVLSSSDASPSGGLRHLERYAGMRVQINSLMVTGPTDGTLNEAAATATSSGIFWGVITGVPRPFREPGYDPQDQPPTGIVPPGFPSGTPVWDGNPEIIQIDTSPATKLDVTSGATVSNLVGVLDFSSRFYTLREDPGNVATVTGNVTYTAVSDALPSDLTIANFNMEHFYDTIDDPGDDVALTPTAYAGRKTKASMAIRLVLKMPDVVCVEELEKLSILQDLASQINSDAVAASQPNPNYVAYLISPTNDISDINIGFLVKSKVAVNSATQLGLTATFTNPNSGAQSILFDRPPLVLQVSASRGPGYQPLNITVIGNHLLSLLSENDNTADGSTTNGDRARAKKQGQAEFMATYVQGLVNANPNGNYLMIGDFNAFEFNDGYVDVMGTIRGTPTPANQVVRASPDLLNPDLTDLVTYAAPGQAYSYVYNGSAQELDHLNVNPNLLNYFRHYEVARNNADFPLVLHGDFTRPERLSDHDMPIAYFTLPSDQSPVATGQSQTVTYPSAAFALNASDPDGDALTYQQTVAPTKGSVNVTCTNTCTATYTANFGASGMDSFRYYVSDPSGAVSASATVNITIQAADVTGQVTWTTTGFSAPRGSNTKSGTVKVTNTGATTIPSPVQMVLTGITPGVTIVNATGTLSSGPYAGSPYYTIPGTSGLAAGATASQTVQLQYSGTAPITFVVKALSGGVN